MPVVRFMTRHRRYGRGQSMVEFALVLPVLLLMMLGVADLARAVYYYNVISNSAREGAREAVLAYNQCSNISASSCGSGPPSGSSLLGVDNAIDRAGGGIVRYQFPQSTNAPQAVAPACSVQNNLGCAWVFVVNGTTRNSCSPPNPSSSGGTDTYTICDFNTSKQGGHDVVVEIQYKFVPFTPLVANALGNSTVMWAKSQMRTEY